MQKPWQTPTESNRNILTEIIKNVMFTVPIMGEIIVQLNWRMVLINFCLPWILKTDPQKDCPSFLLSPPPHIIHSPVGIPLFSETFNNVFIFFTNDSMGAGNLKKQNKKQKPKHNVAMPFEQWKRTQKEAAHLFLKHSKICWTEQSVKLSIAHQTLAST